MSLKGVGVEGSVKGSLNEKPDVAKYCVQPGVADAIGRWLLYSERDLQRLFSCARIETLPPRISYKPMFLSSLRWKHSQSCYAMMQ